MMTRAASSVEQANPRQSASGPSAPLRYRRKRSANVWHYNPRNFDIEVGDLLVDHLGNLFRAEESSGWGKACLGELYPRKVKPPHKGLKAVIRDGEIYWENANVQTSPPEPQ